MNLFGWILALISYGGISFFVQLSPGNEERFWNLAYIFQLFFWIHACWNTVKRSEAKSLRLN